MPQENAGVSAERLAEVHQSDAVVDAAVVLDIPDPLVELQVFGRRIGGVEVDRVETSLPRRGLGVLK